MAQLSAWTPEHIALHWQNSFGHMRGVESLRTFYGIRLRELRKVRNLQAVESITCLFTIWIGGSYGAGIFKAWGSIVRCLFLAMHSARGLAPALLSIGSMSPTRLSLSMVASLQCPLPFHPAKVIVAALGTNVEDAVCCRRSCRSVVLTLFAHTFAPLS